MTCVTVPSDHLRDRPAWSKSGYSADQAFGHQVGVANCSTERVAQDLKLRLASETGRHAYSTSERLSTDGSPAAVPTAVLHSCADALSSAVDGVDTVAFSQAVEVLAAADHVLVVGVGTSAPLAQDAADRLRSIGLLAEAPPDAHVQHVCARLLRPAAVCLAVSHTGQTRETLTTVAAARRAGATTLAVTSFYHSPLTDLCDHALVAGSAETSQHVEARASRLVHIALLDALHAAVSLANPERTHTAHALAADSITDHRL